mmetsp:Transcript_8974/g.15834  ORF Transcript_8974/g.15834 Transcript_8974/m.15834 type:complete len:323 (-) Transcript_8974:19-987(-)
MQVELDRHLSRRKSWVTESGETWESPAKNSAASAKSWQESPERTAQVPDLGSEDMSSSHGSPLNRPLRHSTDSELTQELADRLNSRLLELEDHQLRLQSDLQSLSGRVTSCEAQFETLELGDWLDERLNLLHGKLELELCAHVDRLLATSVASKALDGSSPEMSGKLQKEVGDLAARVEEHEVRLSTCQIRLEAEEERFSRDLAARKETLAGLEKKVAQLQRQNRAEARCQDSERADLEKLSSKLSQMEERGSRLQEGIMADIHQAVRDEYERLVLGLATAELPSRTSRTSGDKGNRESTADEKNLSSRSSFTDTTTRVLNG